MNDSVFGFFRDAPVGRKLTMVSLGYIVAMACVIGFTILAFRGLTADATVIDLAGRQRMLTEQYAKEVLLKGEGLETAPQSVIEVFDRTLEALVVGGRAVENLALGTEVVLPPANVEGAQAQLGRQRELSRRLQEAATAYLDTAPGSAERTERLRAMFEAQVALKSEANALVKSFTADAAARIMRIVNWEILLAAVFAVVALATNWAIGRWISRPLAQCAETAQAIAAGELRDRRLDVKGRDEIGRLARAFNEMIASLREMSLQTREVTENLNSAAAEVLATTQQQASASKQQAAAVQEITSTVEEISQSSVQVSERSRAVATAAQSMSVSGAEGLQSVHQTSEAMEAIRAQAETVAENVVALSERTQAIGAIIATVNDIAEQSNLVALNAAIEAADARDEGRRFAVVANEIKNLADQAKEATGQVRTILGEIQKGINSSVMVTEEAVKRVELGRQKTRSAEDSIRKMADNIQENVSAFQQIVGATNQQQIGLEQVTHALHEIRQASQQSATATRELETAAGNFTDLSEQLRRVVEKYKV